MKSPIKALIFDMDGVVVDSEHLWRKAMIEGFGEIGITFTEDDCRKTTGMRFKEVVEIWLQHYNITAFSVPQVEKIVLDRLLDLIAKEGKAIEGAMDIYHFCRKHNLKIGLATSSYMVLVNAVLEKLQLKNSFDSIVSAEKMKFGKPHPEVFLKCAEELKVLPSECIVIEDSINGVIAAKAAQMRVFTVPDVDHKFNKQFGVADWQCENMHEVKSELLNLLAHPAT
jgi:HAD superfamily hydrolase (TIGR01509 family)